MCFNTTTCKRTHPREKKELSCGRVSICLWMQGWIQGMKSSWIAECSAQKCNYIFSISIHVSMLCLSLYRCFFEYSSTYKWENHHKICTNITDLWNHCRPKPLCRWWNSIVWELTISTLTLFNHSGPFSHSLLNFRKFAQRLRFDILRESGLVFYPLVRTTINNQ